MFAKLIKISYDKKQDFNNGANLVYTYACFVYTFFCRNNQKRI